MTDIPKQISVSEVWSIFGGGSVISKGEPFVVRTNFPTKNPRVGGGFRGLFYAFVVAGAVVFAYARNRSVNCDGVSRVRTFFS